MTRPSSQDRPVGVRTNGTGNACTRHLNLTRSLADVEVALPSASPKMTVRALPIQRPPFAGYDPTERAWK